MSMNDDRHDEPGCTAEESAVAFGSLQHELAERLQTTGNYLSVARRLLDGASSKPMSVSEVIDKAIEQLGRAQATFHQLRRDR